MYVNIHLFILIQLTVKYVNYKANFKNKAPDEIDRYVIPRYFHGYLKSLNFIEHNSILSENNIKPKQ